MVNRQLYILRGIPGIGKSTWIEQNNLTEYTISSDELRLQYPMTTLPDGRKVITQLFDEQVWKELYNILEKRMLRGDKVIIIDATHNKLRYITKYEYLAYEYGYDINVVEFDNNIELAKEQNKKRDSYKYVPEKVIDDMAARITNSKKELRDRYNVFTPSSAVSHIVNILHQEEIELEDLYDYTTYDTVMDYVNNISTYIPAAKLLRNFN